jgi:hypothetical protein
MHMSYELSSIGRILHYIRIGVRTLIIQIMHMIIQQTHHAHTCAMQEIVISTFFQQIFDTKMIKQSDFEKIGHKKVYQSLQPYFFFAVSFSSPFLDPYVLFILVN